MKVSDLPQVKALSLPDKLRLVEELWNEIAAKPDMLTLPAWHVAELDRDFAAYGQDPAEGSSWADVRARIFKRK